MRHSEPRPRAPIGLIASAVLAVVGLILVFILIGWYVVQLVADAHPLLVDVLGVVAAVGLVALVLGGPAIGLLTVYRRYADHRYIQAHHVTMLTRAQTQVAPLASSYHHHIETNSAAAEQQLLTAPIEVVKPLAEWLQWIDEQPHCLLGGRTKAGKTWLATALLEYRLKAGETVFIVDPHSSDWLGLPTAGSVARKGELGRALGAVLAEYIRRMALRDEHKRTTGHELPHDYFGRMTVLIDEANEIADALTSEWRTILKQLGSGSRKIGISLLILGQSALVEDLLISGAMRENFARLALDDRTVQTMVDGERDRARKDALRAALVGMDRPASAQFGAQVWLLDRRGMAPGSAPAGADALMWQGWDFAGGMAAHAAQAPQRATPQPLTTAAPATMVPAALPMAPTIRISFSLEDDILLLLASRSMTAAEIEKALPKVSPKTIYNNLTKLKRDGRIRNEGKRWLI